MQMPNHLVQIIPHPYKLAVDNPVCVAGWSALRKRAALIENQRASEMNGTHSDGLCTAYEAFVFRRRKTEIELLVSRL
jgi:Fe-S cluster biosynthesis and repair protein YggX